MKQPISWEVLSHVSRGLSYSEGTEEKHSPLRRPPLVAVQCTEKSDRRGLPSCLRWRTFGPVYALRVSEGMMRRPIIACKWCTVVNYFPRKFWRQWTMNGQLLLEQTLDVAWEACTMTHVEPLERLGSGETSQLEFRKRVNFRSERSELRADSSNALDITGCL